MAPISNPYHYKAFGLKVNQVGKISYLLEFVETPTFCCPHVDPTACSNFSPRTVEPRPLESREIFLFPFLLSPFPPFSLYERFPFLFLFFLSFPSFLLFYSFLFSHLIFSSFSPFLWSFSLPFWSNHSFGQKEEISSPFPQTKDVAITFPSLFPYFLNPLYDTITTWLNVSHGIHFPHMANCEPFFQCQVSLSYGAMWHPLTLPCVIRHPTPRKT